MAISTYKVFLMKKDTDTYKKLVDIKDFPDLGGEPNMLETTTLSNKMQTYIEGVKNMTALSFTANYTKEDYAALKALAETEAEYAVWFGGTEAEGVLTPTGTDGKFSFKGTLSVYPVGTGVNSVINMKISIVPTTEITSE